jgi:hypothetical protein
MLPDNPAHLLRRMIPAPPPGSRTAACDETTADLARTLMLALNESNESIIPAMLLILSAAN